MSNAVYFPGGSATSFSSCCSSLQPSAVWRTTPAPLLDGSGYGLMIGAGNSGGEGAALSTSKLSGALPAVIARIAPPSRNSASEPGALP